MKNFVLILFLLSLSSTYGQQIKLYRTIYYPAQPYGGEEGITAFFKQEMVYPEIALEEEIEGDVYIIYIVDSKGKFKYKKIEDNSQPLLKEEADRIFNKVVWVADKSRDDENLGYEKIKISFDLKKYKKIAKKRGYHHLPYDSSLSHSKSIKVYQPKQLDEVPEVVNANSLNEIVSENFKFPSIAKERGVSGKVTVEFVVEQYGLASNIQILEPLAGGCNDETIRLMRMIRWKPAIKDGESVRSFYRYSLNFMNPDAPIR
jgi:protein TonB